jgi:succinate dehydrogenase / fumarate reductase cytochrome b subunit
MALQTRSPAHLWQSSVGKKAVMAVTGVILFLFVVAHMVGNFKIFLGPRHFDEYSDFLRTIGSPALGRSRYLWIQRTGLVAAVVLHMTAAYQLTMMSRRARPVRYVHADHVASTYAARTMRWGGVIIILFVIFHLLDLTTGAANPDFVHGQPYHNVVESFSRWYVSLFYIAAVVALGQHLYHGIWSMCQTLGLRLAGEAEPILRRIAGVTAVVITLGFVSVPVAVMTGIVD